MDAIRDEQLENYRRDGLLTGIRILKNDEADAFRREFDALEEKEGPEKCGIGLGNRHMDDEFIWELAIHPRILDAVEAIIGPDILLLASQFFCKYGPDKEKFVAWHQDVTYWGLEPPEALTAWYAVDDSDAGNGCMRAIPGSHASGVREHGESESGENLLSINQEVAVSAEEEASAVDMPLRAGEISLHDGALIHGSLPNLSTRRRSGLTLRYIRPSVRQARVNSMGKMYRAILVRGEDRENHFGGLNPPFEISRK
jgi:ectoine hydroxylase-related dioxygenase (phytanoyl-CoA dioxygenase family)